MYELAKGVSCKKILYAGALCVCVSIVVHTIAVACPTPSIMWQIHAIFTTKSLSYTPNMCVEIDRIG